MCDKKRVVVTGIGLLTPVGKNKTESWSSIVGGRSGISHFTTSKNLGYASPIAGQVEHLPACSLLSSQDQRRTSRFIQLALCAGHEAVVDAGLSETFPSARDRFGAYVGVGIGGLGIMESTSIDFEQRGHRAISPLILPKVISNQAPAWLSMKLQLQGPTMAVVNACSSGNDAIGQAFRAIQDGHADYMLAGGTESCLTPMAFVGFGNMRALSSWKGDPQTASRPFDKDRSGFVLSEGAGFLLLEREDYARKRGASIYAELVGYGAHSDAYHITAIHPDGRGAIFSINSALKQADITSDRIGYINAHGTATHMNDPSETAIIKKVFGDNVPVSSTKSMTGHMLGAAGGVEVAFTALAIKESVLPPTINLEEPDKLCDLDYISDGARRKSVDYALSNSFGFGGANSVILLKRYS